MTPRKPGRPPGGGMSGRIQSVRAPAQLQAALAELAAARGVSEAEIIRLALAKYLADPPACEISEPDSK